MLYKINYIKKLFQHSKPDTHDSMATVHGTRCVLHVSNLALFGVVIILTVSSLLIYFLMPVTDVFELSKTIKEQKVEVILDTKSVDVGPKKKEAMGDETFSVISERNVFSHKRKEWVVKSVIPKASGLKDKELARNGFAKKALAKKRALAGKPKKIILHGVVIAGDIKKALINNPLKGVVKKKTIYIEEGDELEGYKVTSIERDRIKLDWHGEEIIVMLYSGLKDMSPGGNTGKVKSGGLTKVESKFKVVEGVQTDESFNTEIKKVAYANMFDDRSYNPVNKGPAFFMPVLDEVQLSGTVKMQEVVELFPETGHNDTGPSEEEQETVKVEKPKDIVLHGIVIAGDIKKALVNISKSGFGNNRTLYVEEGDGLGEYKVMSIGPDRLMLDWYGEEIIVKFPSL